MPPVPRPAPPRDRAAAPNPHQAYAPPFWLRNGLALSAYIARWAGRTWETTVADPAPPETEVEFVGAGNLPLYGRIALPARPRGTLVATYGIVGSLDDQWYLKLLVRKAVARGYAVVTFDWRAHGRTGLRSPVLTSDGLFEGEDYLRVAARALELGCPGPLWLAGYSLSGQMALWGARIAETEPERLNDLPGGAAALEALAGTVAICPSLDATRSLRYLMAHPVYRYAESAIARQLKALVQTLHRAHPGEFDPEAIARTQTIWDFDREFVIPRLGFPSVEAYYAASSPLPWLPRLRHPTWVLYAENDPLFWPGLVPELQEASAANPALHLWLTRWGGHVGYWASRACQERWGDRDRWWGWNRLLDWCDRWSDGPPAQPGQ